MRFFPMNVSRCMARVTHLLPRGLDGRIESGPAQKRESSCAPGAYSIDLQKNSVEKISGHASSSRQQCALAVTGQRSLEHERFLTQGQHAHGALCRHRRAMGTALPVSGAPWSSSLRQSEAFRALRAEAAFAAEYPGADRALRRIGKRSRGHSKTYTLLSMQQSHHCSTACASFPFTFPTT
jgi:hypothetical protein